jgi:hypothetical protein
MKFQTFSYKTYGTRKFGVTFYSNLKGYGVKVYFNRDVGVLILETNGKSKTNTDNI